jgi:calcium binding protein
MRKSGRNTTSPKARKAPWPPSKRRLRELVEEAIVDAYNESEQRTGFFTMMEEHLALPFDTELLDVTVSVERIDLTIADEIVAICRRGGKRQSIPILDLPLPKPPPAGAEWIEAYRLWLKGA